ncbi:GNAT family N-acetyltransferase [Streptosporangium soli]|nr:GNAT family N-acetyltransferase [Streptosporangium sp. KLBMP 9127]
MLQWLERDPVLNTVPLTVLHRLRLGQFSDGALLGRLTDDGVVAGVAIRTPPYPLLLGAIPEGSAKALAETLRDHDLPGVNGPLAQADAFAASWHRPETGRMSQRLYFLDTLTAPAAEGEARVAVAGDIAFVVEWYSAFLAEAEPANAGDDPTSQVTVRIRAGEILLWEADGRPVAVAAFSTPLAGMSRIGPVYTLPNARGKGYGSAVTHAASRAAQRAGAGRVLLLTDLANPTSNSIYQAIGYRPVSDYASVRF